jgi:hypothetical protein
MLKIWKPLHFENLACYWETDIQSLHIEPCSLPSVTQVLIPYENADAMA